MRLDIAAEEEGAAGEGAAGEGAEKEADDARNPAYKPVLFYP